MFIFAHNLHSLYIIYISLLKSATFMHFTFLCQVYKMCHRKELYFAKLPTLKTAKYKYLVDVMVGTGWSNVLLNSCSLCGFSSLYMSRKELLSFC